MVCVVHRVHGTHAPNDSARWEVALHQPGSIRQGHTAAATHREPRNGVLCNKWYRWPTRSDRKVQPALITKKVMQQSQMACGAVPAAAAHNIKSLQPTCTHKPVASEQHTAAGLHEQQSGTWLANPSLTGIYLCQRKFSSIKVCKQASKCIASRVQHPIDACQPFVAWTAA